MREFDTLTDWGKIRRLRKAAEVALQYYNLRVTRFRLLAYDTNHIFRIDCVDGKKYVLRICSDQETTLEDNCIEAFWLRAIERDTDLNVVRLIPRTDGELVCRVSVSGVPPDRRCMLFSWVTGRDLESDITPTRYYQLGQVTARLHEYTRQLAIPADLHARRWDRIFYFPDEECIYRQPAYRRYFSTERVRLLDEARSVAEPLLAGLYQSGRQPMLIHGDLHYGNVRVYHGQLCLLDFESVLLGYPEQDIAITLYYGRNRKDYAELVDAYKDGYTSQRAWPLVSDAQLHGLMAARSVNFINYAARYSPDADERLASMFERLKKSLAIVHQGN